MKAAALAVVLAATFAGSSVVGRRLTAAGRELRWMAVLVVWLCALIVPLQLLALPGVLGWDWPMRVGDRLLLDGLFVAAAAWWWRRGGRRAEEGGRGAGGPTPGWHLKAGVAVAAGVYGLLAARMWWAYPSEWDAVAYHYPVALKWLQEGTLRIGSGTNWRAALPGNVELLDLLMMWAGLERWLGAVQWPGLALLLLACASLARRLGQAGTAWPVATTVAMIPVVANQAMSGYVDLLGTAALAAGAALALEARDGGAGRRGLWGAAGLACGLALGAKPVFWVYGGVLCCAAAWMARRRWREAAWFAAGVAVPALFWFGRAAWDTGNPVYPMAVEVGWLKLAGWRPAEITEPNYYQMHVARPALWLVYPWTETSRAPGFLGRNYTTGHGLGGAFATFAMPGVAYALWLARRRRPELRGWVAALAVIGLLWWFPLQSVGRFGLPLAVLMAVLAAPWYGVLERTRSRLYRAVYVSVLALTAAVLALEPAYTMAQAVRQGGLSRAGAYGYPEQLDRLPAGRRVLYRGHELLNLAVAGEGLRNRVIASWEGGVRMEGEELRRRGVDSVVERRERGEQWVWDAPPAEGWALAYEGEAGQAEWRIWRRSEPGGRDQ